MSKKTTKEIYEAGFTLVEVMVVMVIIGLLSTFVFLNFAPVTGRANVVKAQGDIRSIEQSLEFYKADMFDYPPQSAGLSALSKVPQGVQYADRYPQGGYVRSLPKDPWGNDYVYRYPGQNGNGTFDLLSYGADGQEGGEGPAADIVNWATE